MKYWTDEEIVQIKDEIEDMLASDNADIERAKEILDILPQVISQVYNSAYQTNINDNYRSNNANYTWSDLEQDEIETIDYNDFYNSLRSLMDELKNLVNSKSLC